MKAAPPFVSYLCLLSGATFFRLPRGRGHVVGRDLGRDSGAVVHVRVARALRRRDVGGVDLHPVRPVEDGADGRRGRLVRLRHTLPPRRGARPAPWAPLGRAVGGGRGRGRVARVRHVRGHGGRGRAGQQGGTNQ